MKRLLFLLPVALFAGLAVAFAVGLTRDPKILPSELIGKSLPAIDRPSAIAGQPAFSNAAIRGEPALINVFASWCGPCVVEHPTLMRAQREGFALYGVDWKEPAVDGARWLADRGDPYRAVASDPGGRAGIDLGITGVPETFVVDARGIVRYRHVGPIMDRDWDETLKPLLAKLRAEG